VYVLFLGTILESSTRSTRRAISVPRGELWATPGRQGRVPGKGVGVRGKPGSSPGCSSKAPSPGRLLRWASHPGQRVLGPGRVACMLGAGLSPPRRGGSRTYRGGSGGRPGVTVARGGGRGGCAGRGWARPAEGCSAPRAPPAPSPQRRPAQRPSRAEPLLSVRRRQARSQTCPAAPEGAGGHARGSEWGSGTRSPVSPGAAAPPHDSRPRPPPSPARSAQGAKLRPLAAGSKDREFRSPEGDRSRLGEPGHRGHPHTGRGSGEGAGGRQSVLYGAQNGPTPRNWEQGNSWGWEVRESSLCRTGRRPEGDGFYVSAYGGNQQKSTLASA
jgi:hypothetical protein